MKLCHDVKKIKASNKMFVSADKSRHIYKMDECNKLLHNNITKTYKKSNAKKLRDIDFAAKEIIEKLSIAGRVKVMQETEEYITVKDDKDEFPNKTPCHLINPSKSSIGNISKAISSIQYGGIETKNQTRKFIHNFLPQCFISQNSDRNNSIRIILIKIISRLI